MSMSNSAVLEDILRSVVKTDTQFKEVKSFFDAEEVDSVEVIRTMTDKAYLRLIDKIHPGGRGARVKATLDPYRQELTSREKKELERLQQREQEQRQQVLKLDATISIIDQLLQPIVLPMRFNLQELQSLLDLPLTRKIISTAPILDVIETACFECSDTHCCADLEATVRLAIGGRNFPGTQASEMDWSGYWDAFFFIGFLRLAIYHNQLRNINTFRNAEESSSTTPKSRRDFNLQGNNVLLFAGEDKLKQSEADTAAKELLEKTSANAALYGHLKYFLAFTTAGPRVRFFAVVLPDEHETEQKPRLERLQREYDVTIPGQRVKLYIALINVCRWVRSVISNDVLDSNAVSTITPITRKSAYDGRETTTIINKGKYIEKRIWLPQHYILQFERVYTAVQGIESKYHCKLKDLMVAEGMGTGSGTSRMDFLGKSFVQPSKISGDGVWVILQLTPIGARWLPKGDEAVWECFMQILSFLEAFHAKGFVHRDLRWPNILSHSEGYWFVIDFEMADAIGEEPWWDNLGMHVEKGKKSTVHTDLYQVGLLLENTTKFAEVCSKLKHDEYPSATEALKDLRHYGKSVWKLFRELKI